MITILAALIIRMTLLAGRSVENCCSALIQKDCSSKQSTCNIRTGRELSKGHNRNTAMNPTQGPMDRSEFPKVVAREPPVVINDSKCSVSFFKIKAYYLYTQKKHMICM
jgi:hypothetical protein